MEVNYQEFSPSEALKPYVDCYWAMSFGGMSTDVSPDQHCLPLGLMEMVFHLNDDPYQVSIEGKKDLLPASFIAGMYEVPVSWNAVGGSRSFGIRIKPECMLELFGVPVSVVFQEYTELQNFFGNGAKELTEQMRNAPDTGSRIRLAESFILKYMRDRQRERNYVMEATRLIRQSVGNISLEDLSDQLYISPRQLQRSFKNHIGTSPKTFMRIIRFASAYDYVQKQEESLNWANLSYHFGYSDQAHFIRDFKQFTGRAPTIMIDERRQFYQRSRQLVAG